MLPHKNVPQSNRPASTRNVDLRIAADVHDRLRYLAIDFDVEVEDLIIDGVFLLLRYHDVGRGLPEPTPRGGAA
jgi:hypothetical protein